MGVNITSAVWKHSKSKGRARTTLLAIADHQGEIGAWPSIKTLAKMVNTSERSIQRDISELVALGELTVEVQNAPTNRQYKSNLYWVTLPGVTESSAGVTDSVSGVTELASGVTTVGALTITKPLLKPLLNSYRLPDDWQPRENDIELMREHFPSIDLKLETHAFRDYWRSVPGARGKKADWDATWRNWIRNGYKRNKPKENKTDWNELDRWAKEQDEKNANN